jgi:hypothetical protein
VGSEYPEEVDVDDDKDTEEDAVDGTAFDHVIDVDSDEDAE